MDFEALRTFIAIEETKSFSAAAEQLHRTQPAISRRIALLEDEFGVSLFERTSAGVTLSEAGRALLPLAVRALAAVKDASEAVEAFRVEARGPVSLAIVGTLASTNLTRVLKRFASQFAAVELSLRTATSAEVSELVRRGDAMIGLRYFDDPSHDLVSRPIARERLVVICASKHRHAGKRVDGLAELSAERWLAFPNVGGQRELSPPHIQALFEARSLGVPKWNAVDSLTAQKRLVEAGFGLALVPESAIDEELRQKSLTLVRVGDLAVANPISVVTRREGFLGAAAKALLAAVLAEYSNATGTRRKRLSGSSC